MRTSLNLLTCFLACVTVTVPALAQQAGVDEPYPYMAVWLTGELDRGCAGVVFSRKYKTMGYIELKDATTVAEPGGRVWDLSTDEGFTRFLETHLNTVSIIVSTTGGLTFETVGKSPIGGLVSISTKIDARQDLFAGGSKVGTQTTKVQVTGLLAVVRGGPYGAEGSLLPTEEVYSARGTIVTSYTGAGKHEEVAQYFGTVLGLLNGKLTLGLRALTGATYVIPDFVNVAMGRDVYRGLVYRDDSFGFTKAGSSGSGTCVAPTSHQTREAKNLSEIHAAARDGNLVKVTALLKGNPDLVSSKDNNGDTPLHWAALNGHKDVAELLLANNGDVNAKDNGHRTPLHYAEGGGHSDVAELLRQHGGHE